MTDITIITGSTLGSAEYVAEHLVGILEDHGFTADVLHGPELTELEPHGMWLFVTSTHGAGESCRPYAARSKKLPGRDSRPYSHTARMSRTTCQARKLSRKAGTTE